MTHCPGRLASVVIAGLTLGVTACTSSHATTAAPKVPKVSFLTANTELNFSQEMADGFRFGVKGVGGVDQQVVGPNIVDGPKQVAMFAQLAKTSTGGISVFTLTPELLADEFRQAATAGIPVIAVDNPPPPDSKVSTFVGNDNKELGRKLADLVISRLPKNPTGSVVLGTSSPGAPVLDRRADGMRTEFHLKVPGVTVLGPFDTKQEVAANFQAWDVLVQANSDALAFLGTGDADGWNLAAIRQRTHGKWLAAAFDLDPKAMRAVKSGDLLLVSPEHFIKGAIAGHLQAVNAKGDGALPKGWIYTPGLDVTPANIDAIIAREASESAKEAWFGPQVADILKNLSASTRPLNQAG